MYKVITDPKTGKMSTTDSVAGPTKESLAKQRKELRDMLDGNKPFHMDPNSPQPEKRDEQTDNDDDGFGYGYFIF